MPVGDTNNERTAGCDLVVLARGVEGSSLAEARFTDISDVYRGLSPGRIARNFPCRAAF
jgi:hypothetical protein